MIGLGIDSSSSQAALFMASARPEVREVRPQGKVWTEREVVKARDAVKQLVGGTFFGLMLKELRKTTRNDHLLFGGRGEQTLQLLFDQELVKHLAESSNFELSQAAFERMYPKAAGSKVFSPEKIDALLAKERS